MKLQGGVIHFGGHVITSETLKRDAANWRGMALLPGISGDNLSDFEVLRRLLYETTPIIITPDMDAGNLIFQAVLRRWKYSIVTTRMGRPVRTQSGFSNFSIRLVPSAGKVRLVTLDRSSHCAVNGFVVDARESVQAEFGNGSVHLELYFHPGPTAGISSISQPAGHQPVVTIAEEDAID